MTLDLYVLLEREVPMISVGPPRVPAAASGKPDLPGRDPDAHAVAPVCPHAIVREEK